VVAPSVLHLKLIDRVARDPTDEVTWQILADLLIENGDPRGEYIALSMKTTQSANLKKKLAKLFKRYRSSWLGPLETVVLPEVEPEIWHRGFPVRFGCVLTGSTERAKEWLTVRELIVAAPEEHEQWPLELLAETTPNLRAIYPVSAGWLSREGLVQDARWPNRLEKWLKEHGRERLLNFSGVVE
jgi:uncharacterized protein (TIGR02996 family)